MAGIGNLKPIKLIRYTSTIDGNGDAEESVEIIYKMWAEISDNGGGRSQSEGRTVMSDTKEFKVNFRNYLIDGDYKIQYFGQIYAITSIERIDEKRFNYRLIGNNIFVSASSVQEPTLPTNWTSATYNQTTGQLIFTGGSVDSYYTNLQILKYPFDGTTYVNAYNEAFGVGPFPGDNPSPGVNWTFFTPGQVLLKWRRVLGQSPFSPLSEYNEQVLTITRLARRWFGVYNKENNELRTTGAFPFRAWDVDDNDLGIVNNVAEYISVMNAAIPNQSCFTVVSDASDSSGMKFNCDPLAPYQSWNFGPPLKLYASNS